MLRDIPAVVRIMITFWQHVYVMKNEAIERHIFSNPLCDVNKRSVHDPSFVEYSIIVLFGNKHTIFHFLTLKKFTTLDRPRMT